MITLNSISKDYEDLWETEDTFGDESMSRGLLNGFQIYEYESETSCTCSIYTHVDPQITGIPDALLNLVSKRVIANAFENLKTGEVFHKEIMHNAVVKQADLCIDLS